MIVRNIPVCSEGLLQTTADGSTRIMDYADDMTMAKSCMKIHTGLLSAGAPGHPCVFPAKSAASDRWVQERFCLPCSPTSCFQTKKAEKTLIIDAKFYTHNMQMKATLYDANAPLQNLYQIFTYVKNWDAAPGETVAGCFYTPRQTMPFSRMEITK